MNVKIFLLLFLKTFLNIDQITLTWYLTFLSINHLKTPDTGDRDGGLVSSRPRILQLLRPSPLGNLFAPVTLLFKMYNVDIPQLEVCPYFYFDNCNLFRKSTQAHVCLCLTELLLSTLIETYFKFAFLGKFLAYDRIVRGR